MVTMETSQSNYCTFEHFSYCVRLMVRLTTHLKKKKVEAVTNSSINSVQFYNTLV